MATSGPTVTFYSQGPLTCQSVCLIANNPGSSRVHYKHKDVSVTLILTLTTRGAMWVGVKSIIIAVSHGSLVSTQVCIQPSILHVSQTCTCSAHLKSYISHVAARYPKMHFTAVSDSSREYVLQSRPLVYSEVHKSVLACLKTRHYTQTHEHANVSGTQPTNPRKGWNVKIKQGFCGLRMVQLFVPVCEH